MGEGGHRLQWASWRSARASLLQRALLPVGMRLFLLLNLALGAALPPSGTPARAQELATPAAINLDEEIVYIDSAGVIRVLDPVPPSGQSAVAWYSPAGNWERTALGDFNNDTDLEIVAITDEGGPKLTIYDPVVTTGPVVMSQQINGIFWATLYELALPAAPNLVGVGEFNLAVPGAEIVVVYDEPPDQRTPGDTPDPRVRIMTQRSATPDGRTWETLTEVEASGRWTDLATGNLEGSGIDNLVLVDEEASDLVVYRVSNGQLSRYYRRPSDNKTWHDAQIGPVDPATALPELVLARQAVSPLHSLLVWRYAGDNEFADVTGRDYEPEPRALFLADVTGNGDDEIFMLRQLTVPSPAPQLLSTNVGPESPSPVQFELTLDLPFRYGAGGDVDGDGKDEIALNSRQQIRLFNSPNTSTTDTTNYPVDSKAAPFQIGNLDRIGYYLPPTLSTTAPTDGPLLFSVPAGAVSAPSAIDVYNSTTADPITFFAYTLPAVPFLTWTESGNTTRATLRLTVDATDLLPGGRVGANLLIDTTQAQVDGAPVTVQVLADITAGVVVRPHDAVVSVQPCMGTGLAQREVTLDILGTAGSTFSAAVGASNGNENDAAATAHSPTVSPAGIDWPSTVPWITAAQSVTNTVPATITLTINPNLGANQAKARVTLRATVEGAGSQERTATVTLICTQYGHYLPVVVR